MLFTSFIITSAFALLGLFLIFLFFSYFGEKKLQLSGISRCLACRQKMCLIVLSQDCIYLELSYAISVHILVGVEASLSSWYGLIVRKLPWMYFSKPSHVKSKIPVMENFPEHAKRKIFSGTSRLFSCIVLFWARSNDTGFLFWISKPLYYIRSILCMCGCIYPISLFFSLRRDLSLCSLWAMFCCSEIICAYNRLLVCLSSWKTDQPGK